MALIPGGVGSVLSSWQRLRQVKAYPPALLVAAAATGGVIGAVLLGLALPAFAALIPRKPFPGLAAPARVAMRTTIFHRI